MAERSAFRLGLDFGLGVIGAFPTSIALFNLVVHQFDLPLSQIVEPLVSLYREIIGPLIGTIKAGIPTWAFPDWNHDLLVAVYVLALVGVRSVILSGIKREGGENVGGTLFLTGFVPLFGVTIALVFPYFRYVVFLMAGYPLIFLIGGETADDRKIGAWACLYVLGCIVGAGALLVLNIYY